ncbi:MAG: hypothetical protein H6727_06345 [Myxococcales bacterium]|nr:hypothetical protein [Myxococcales bacterium]
MEKQTKRDDLLLKERRKPSSWQGRWLGLFFGLVVLSFWSCDPVPPKEAVSEKVQEAITETSQEPVSQDAQEAAIEASLEPSKETGLEISPEASPETTSPEASPEVSPEVSPEESVSQPEEQVVVEDGGAEKSPEKVEIVPEKTEVVPEGTPETNPSDLCAQGPKSTTFGTDTVTVQCTTQADGTRQYTLSTTHALRDNDPASKQVTFTEKADDPRFRSGNLLWDALFAMSIEEVRQNSVQAVYEGGFNQGNPVSCACFQTGAKWTWAWTRDTSYAVDLGLAWLDPTRAENTLRFKLSTWKTALGGASAGSQIVQDTGTGGAWPVSSDRVIWALAARKLSWVMDPTKRSAFLQAVYPALEGTIAQDRQMIYDPTDGLYRGEQSFLDWREQTYPAWVKEKLEHIAMSKTLSTNVAHAILLDWTAWAAGILQKPTDATRYMTWATSLKSSIHSSFYLPTWGMHSTMKTTLLEDAPVAKFDLLGQALAILEGVAPAAEAAKAVESYPVSPVGPPVYWPQQPLTAIYHNRALWPFVTAYWARAARKVGHAESFAHSLMSLVRGSALNLSNMENLEWMTGKNYVSDGAYSGPVVNSRRQLWSVAGYLGAFAEVLMGWEILPDGVRVRPFLPASLQQAAGLAGVVRLEGLPYRGGKIDIEVHLPTQAGSTGAYAIDRIEVDGQALTDLQATIAASRLTSRSKIAVWLRDDNVAAKPIKIVQDTGDYRTLWSPKEPTISSIQKVAGGLALDIDAGGETGVTVDIYRDGQSVASGVAAGRWVDTTAMPDGDTSYCYSAELVFTSSKHRSHRALPRCWKGESDKREQIVDAWRFEHSGGTWKDHAGGAALSDWGDRSHRLLARDIHVNWTGRYHLELMYRNPNGPRSTGITCAVKRVQIFAEASGTTPISTHWVAMPHNETTDVSSSTGFWVDLDASKSYRIEIDEAPNTLHNMSFLEHFSIFSGKGGGAQPWNRVEIVGVRMFPKKGQDQTPTTGKLIAMDGNNDYNKFPSTQSLTPGATLETWERFALTWDDDWLYVAVVSKGFEDDLRAFMLYVEPAQTASAPTAQSTGMTYLQQTSQLPITATHLIGVRYKTDNQDGLGPWSGVWRREAGGWVQQQRFKEGRDVWSASDRHTMSFRIRRSALGGTRWIRLVGHLVYAVSGNEWKAVLPSTHTPWTSSGVGFLQIDLDQSKASSAWLVR